MQDLFGAVLRVGLPRIFRARETERLFALVRQLRAVDTDVMLARSWPVPIEVFRFGHAATAEALRNFGEPVLRMNGTQPFVTDAGGYIYDLKCGPINDPATLERALDQIPGVAETGLFIARATVVIVATGQGLVTLKA